MSKWVRIIWLSGYRGHLIMRWSWRLHFITTSKQIDISLPQSGSSLSPSNSNLLSNTVTLPPGSYYITGSHITVAGDIYGC